MDTELVSFAPLVRMKMLSNTRNASRVRNNRATRMAGLISGTVTIQNRFHTLAPSIEAALSRSSGTRARPAISSRAMNGTVFQTSARMMIQIDDQNEVSGADPSGVSQPRSAVQAKRQEKAATTVTIAYGTSAEVRTSPRPTIVRCMTIASSIPNASSREAPTTVMKIVTPNAVHQIGLDSTVM